MSSTFDAMQYALDWLQSRLPEEDNQARDVIFYLKKIIDSLHDHHHRHDNSLNRAAGIYPELLDTALRHEDDEERAMWLRVKAL